MTEATEAVDYTPKAESGFTGVVKLKIPGFVERMELLGELGIELTGEGASLKPKITPTMPMLIKMLSKVIKQIESVDLKYGDVEIKSVAKLQNYAESMQLFMEIAGVLQNGLTLGKT